MRRPVLSGLTLLLALPPLMGCAGGNPGPARTAALRSAPAAARPAIARPPLRLVAASGAELSGGPLTVLDDPARHPAASAGSPADPATGTPAVLDDPATASGSAASEFEDENDPFEPVNRRFLQLNLALTDNLFGPIAEAYRKVVPAYGRARIHNFLRNLGEPIIFANDVLQGRLLDAGHTTMRFFLNSTAGVGGLYDIAGPAGITRRTGDFGQTLYHYGVPAGPYLVLPLLGPSQVRDAIGDGVDGFGNPISIAINAAATAGVANALNLGRGGLGGLDLLAEHKDDLDELRSTSIDFYSRLRSVVRQQRQAELNRTTEPQVALPIPSGGTLGTGPEGRSPEAVPAAPPILDDPAAPAPASGLPMTFLPEPAPLARGRATPRQVSWRRTAPVRLVHRRTLGHATELAFAPRPTPPAPAPAAAPLMLGSDAALLPVVAASPRPANPPGRVSPTRLSSPARPVHPVPGVALPQPLDPQRRRAS